MYKDLMVYSIDFIRGNVSEERREEWERDINPIYKQTINQINELIKNGCVVYIDGYGIYEDIEFYEV